MHDTDIFGDTDDMIVEENQKLEFLNTNETKYVHVFAHSHTDLGWLSTVEDYFNGNRLDFYIGSVK